MYNALDIARFIVNYGDDKDYFISNLSLQKMLYFVQAWFLVNYDKPCFHEKIEAWSIGPIVPKVHREYKRFGGCTIPRIDHELTYEIKHRDDGSIYFEEKSIPLEELDIEIEHKYAIQDRVDLLSNYHACDLTELSMNQLPWKYAYQKGEGSEITNRLLKLYFEED